MRDVSHEADFSVGLTDNVRKTLRCDWEFRHRERRRKGCMELCGQALNGIGEAAEKNYICKETIKGNNLKNKHAFTRKKYVKQY